MDLRTAPSRIIAFMRDRARRLTHRSQAPTTWYAKLWISVSQPARRLLGRAETTPWYKRPLHR